MYSLSSSPFTSHYVTINSYNPEVSYFRMNKFTSHYVTINSLISFFNATTPFLFTSHYVTINSMESKKCMAPFYNLHPTM